MMTLSEALSIILSRLSHLYTFATDYNITTLHAECCALQYSCYVGIITLIETHYILMMYRKSYHSDTDRELETKSFVPRLMLALVPSGVYIMIWNNSDKWVTTTITTVDSPTNGNLVHGLLHVLYVFCWVVLVKHLPHGLYNAFDTLDKHFNNI